MEAHDWDKLGMTPKDMERALGQSLKRYRVNVRRMDQETLAANAGVSTRTVRSLESGSGSTLQTFMRVMVALGRKSWLASAAPTVLQTLVVVRQERLRERVYKPLRKKPDDCPGADE